MIGISPSELSLVFKLCQPMRRSGYALPVSHRRSIGLYMYHQLGHDVIRVLCTWLSVCLYFLLVLFNVAFRTINRSWMQILLCAIRRIRIIYFGNYTQYNNYRYLLSWKIIDLRCSGVATRALLSHCYLPVLPSAECIVTLMNKFIQHGGSAMMQLRTKDEWWQWWCCSVLNCCGEYQGHAGEPRQQAAGQSPRMPQMKDQFFRAFVICSLKCYSLWSGLSQQIFGLAWIGLAQ